MNTPHASGSFRSPLVLLAVLLAQLAPLAAPLQAATYYWDANGATAGAGSAPTGTWGLSPFWSTSSAGTAATANPTTAFTDPLVFSAGRDATNPYTVTGRPQPSRTVGLSMPIPSRNTSPCAESRRSIRR